MSFRRMYGGTLPKRGLAAPIWMISFSALCSQTTLGMSLGSLVQAVSLYA
jgi:hypothetical protein